MTDWQVMNRRTALKAFAGTLMIGKVAGGGSSDEMDSAISSCEGNPRTPLTVDGEPLSYPELPRQEGRFPRGHQVLYDDSAGLYRMWIAWSWGDGYGQGARIYYYESEDGLDWSVPVRTNLEHSGWEKRLTLGSVLKLDDGRYGMMFTKYYYWTECSGWGGRTFITSSRDGVNWTSPNLVTDGEAFSAHRGRSKAVSPSSDEIWMYGRTSGDGHCDNRWWRYKTSMSAGGWVDETELTLDGETFLDHIDDVEISPDGSRVIAYVRRKGQDGRPLVKAESPVEDGVDFTVTETLVDDLSSEECGAQNNHTLGGVYRDTEDPRKAYYVGFDQSEEQGFRMEMSGPSPKAAFTVETDTPRSEEPVVFDASDSEAPDGEVETYRWRFGDGATLETSEPRVEHSFEAGGSYTVSLKVLDESGASDTTSRDIVLRHTVSIDVKPKSEVPPINPDSEGLTPVEVQGEDEPGLIASLDVESLRFGPPRTVLDGGGATVARSKEGRGSGDGVLLFFRTDEAGFNREDEFAVVAGRTEDGMGVVGFDEIRTVARQGRGGRAAPKGNR